MNTFSPSATRLIRMDHTHVLSTFHQYRSDLAPSTKRALVRTVCLALEIHAQLEEEIFYPAVQAATGDRAVLAKNDPGHVEMKRLIAALRSLEPVDPRQDAVFFELMRVTLHHIADEETHLLPEAERVLRATLNDLGALMVKRRFEITRPRSGELATHLVRALPVGTVAALGVAGLALFVLWRFAAPLVQQTRPRSPWVAG